MALRDYDWEPSYATSDIRDDGQIVDILHDFYIPALSRAVTYDRVAGYFTSTSLAAASQGFSRFINNGGKARFIVGMQLEQEDAEAILQGDEQRTDQHLIQILENCDGWTQATCRGVELLAWMVAQGYLSIRVGLRVHTQTGQPKPFDYAQDGYLHEKWAIFGDGTDQLFIAGSLNESMTALAINAENIMVHPSWDTWGQQVIPKKQRNFDLLWHNQHPAIKTYSLPEAVKAQLIKIARSAKVFTEIDGTPATQVQASLLTRQTQTIHQPSFPERLGFALLRLAPLLPGGEKIGIETTPIEPWPHQRFVAYRLLETYPCNHLLCDEVGLGKTIEAGLIFRALWLSGRAQTIRVFAPAALTQQWLVEMADKFYLPFVRRTNRQGHFERLDEITGESIAGAGQLFDSALEIISTGLLINRSKGRILTDMPDTDVILMDEAHKARRQSPDNRNTFPRFNKLYQELETALYPKSKTLLLATATPMQLNRVEAFDLLKVMPSAGAVQFSEDLSEIFYRIRERLLRQEPLNHPEIEWLRRYLKNVKASAPIHWHFVCDQVLDPFGKMDLDNLVEHNTEPLNWASLQPALSLFAPLGRTMLRHTRSLLRTYQREGLLNANLAKRHVEPVIILLSPVEREVYDQLQTYCADLTRYISANMEAGKQRAAIGFYLSFLRLRYASSFHALRRSLERRLDKIQLTLDHRAQQFTSEAIERDELDELNDDEVEGLVLKYRNETDLTWEQGAVKELLDTMEGLPNTPQKLLQLLKHIDQRLQPGTGRVRQLVVFTRYADTLEFLNNDLCQRLPHCPIGTFSGAGGSLRRAGQSKAEGMERTRIKRLFVDGSIDILLCTDAAAEGLNLQSADLLINFDLPWNPMMLEQRIGRIDRIGQHHQNICVFNYLYQDSVEEVVYSRLVKRFREAVIVSGELQFSLLPIQTEDFEDFAKTEGEQGKITEQELIQRAHQHAQRIIERQELTQFNAEEQKQAYENLDASRRSQPAPIDLAGIWNLITESPYLKALGGYIEHFPQGEAFQIKGIPGIKEDSLLTISRPLFEKGVGSADQRRLHFATYGDPVFEALINTMLDSLPEIQAAWVKREPLSGLLVDGKLLKNHQQLVDFYNLAENTPITLSKRVVPTQKRQSDLLGRHQRMVLDSAAASLAKYKLREQPDTVANQMALLSRFCKDVKRRHSQCFHIPFDSPDRNGTLALADKLLWSIYSQDKEILAEANPLMLEVLSEIIHRQLNDIKKQNRRRDEVYKTLRDKALRFWVR